MRLDRDVSDLLSRLVSCEEIWPMESATTTGVSTWVAWSLMAQLMAPDKPRLLALSCKRQDRRAHLPEMLGARERLVAS